MEKQIHGTAIVIQTRGILLQGASGVGKSSIAAGCLQRAGEMAQFSALVSDDRVNLSRAGGRVLMAAPANIKGWLEMRGVGIAAINYIDKACLHYVIDLQNSEPRPQIPDQYPDIMSLLETPIHRMNLDSRSPTVVDQIFLALSTFKWMDPDEEAG